MMMLGPATRNSDGRRRFARDEAFDEQAMPGLDSEALDFRAASESFAPLRKLKRADLETLRLVTTHQGRKAPTVGGMLLFGRERTRHCPEAWIQAGRVDGKDKARIADQLEIRSYPVQVEAQQLGPGSYASDLNPVVVLINNYDFADLLECAEPPR